MHKLIFGITGASGSILAQICLKEIAKIPDIDLHVIMTEAARIVEKNEQPIQAAGFHLYDNNDLCASPASGSWPVDAMIICPCSINTLGSIAASIASNLLLRAASVTLKERRPLILVIRETPFSLLQLEAMSSVTRAGGIIMPFIPAFYTGYQTMPELIKQFCGHLLNILKIPNNLAAPWEMG